MKINFISSTFIFLTIMISYLPTVVLAQVEIDATLMEDEICIFIQALVDDVIEEFDEVLEEYDNFIVESAADDFVDLFDNVFAEGVVEEPGDFTKEIMQKLVEVQKKLRVFQDEGDVEDLMENINDVTEEFVREFIQAAASTEDFLNRKQKAFLSKLFAVSKILAAKDDYYRAMKMWVITIAFIELDLDVALAPGCTIVDISLGEDDQDEDDQDDEN